MGCYLGRKPLQKPLQKPLPICIGGKGRTRTLPLAARYAHHWNYSGSEPAEFTELRDVLHRSCAEIGRDPGEITCSAIARYAGDDGALRAEVDGWAEVGADLVIVSVPKSEPPAVIESIATALR